MERAFGGKIAGDFWRNLHGELVEEMATKRGSLSHSNPRSPERRTDAGAYAVLVRLVHKGAARLRHMGYAAGQMSLSVKYDDKTQWDAHVGIDFAQDTQTLREVMDHLWRKRAPTKGSPKK